MNDLQIQDLAEYNSDGEAERTDEGEVDGDEVKNEVEEITATRQSVLDLKGLLNANVLTAQAGEATALLANIDGIVEALNALDTTDATTPWTEAELTEAADVLARFEGDALNSQIQALEVSANKALLEKYRDNAVEGYGETLEQGHMFNNVMDKATEFVLEDFAENNEALLASVLRERGLVVDVFNAALSNAQDFNSIDSIRQIFLVGFSDNGEALRLREENRYKGLAAPLEQQYLVVRDVLAPAKTILDDIDTELLLEGLTPEHTAMYEALKTELVQGRDFAVANLDGSLFSKEYYEAQFNAIKDISDAAAAQKEFAVNRMAETARRLSILNPDFEAPEAQFADEDSTVGGRQLNVADINAYLNANFKSLNGDTDFAIADDADAAAITAVADILQAGLAAEEILLARRLEQQYSRRYRDDFVEFAARFDNAEGAILNAGPIARTRVVQERQRELFAVDGEPVNRADNPDDVDGVIGPDTLARAELLASIRNPHVTHNGTAYVLKDGAPDSAEINEEGVVTYASGVTCGLDGVYVKPEDGNIESMDDATGILTYKNGVTRVLNGAYEQPADARVTSINEDGVATYASGVTRGLDGVFVAPTDQPEGFRSISEDGFMRLNNSTLIELDGTRTIAFFYENNPRSIRPVNASGPNRATVLRGVGGFDPSTGVLNLTSHPYWAPDEYGPAEQLQRRPGIRFENGIVKIDEDYELMNQNGITIAGDYTYDHSTGRFTAAESE
jgi:hypothetical protein